MLVSMEVEKVAGVTGNALSQLAAHLGQPTKAVWDMHVKQVIAYGIVNSIFTLILFILAYKLWEYSVRLKKEIEDIEELSFIDCTLLNKREYATSWSGFCLCVSIGLGLWGSYLLSNAILFTANPAYYATQNILRAVTQLTE